MKKLLTIALLLAAAPALFAVSVGGKKMDKKTDKQLTSTLNIKKDGVLANLEQPVKIKDFKYIVLNYQSEEELLNSNNAVDQRRQRLKKTISTEYTPDIVYDWCNFEVTNAGCMDIKEDKLVFSILSDKSNLKGYKQFYTIFINKNSKSMALRRHLEANGTKAYTWYALTGEHGRSLSSEQAGILIAKYPGSTYTHIYQCDSSANLGNNTFEMDRGLIYWNAAPEVFSGKDFGDEKAAWAATPFGKSRQVGIAPFLNYRFEGNKCSPEITAAFRTVFYGKGPVNPSLGEFTHKNPKIEMLINSTALKNAQTDDDFYKFAVQVMKAMLDL